MKKYADVDEFLAEATTWKSVATRLRKVLVKLDLEETIKWGKPCYSHGGNNIAIIQPFKEFLALMFFKGALLDDPDELLEEQGENTRSARRVCFTKVADVTRLQAAVGALVRSAIEVQEQGKTLPKRPAPVLAEELQSRLDGNARLRAAFEKLTPGRQREYNLFISGAKQSKTREARVDKHVDRILAGKGMRDR